MNAIFWGLLVAVTALVVCRWREAGRKIDTAKSLAFTEYEQAVESAKRRHPAGKGLTEPTVLVGRVPWFDRVNGDVERDIDPDGHLSDEQWARLLRAVGEDVQITQEQFDRTKTRVMDEVAKIKGEQA